MGAISMRITGSKEFIAALRRMQSVVLPQLAEIVATFTGKARSESAGIAPRATGALLSSIYSSSVSVNMGKGVAQARVGFESPYATYAEVRSGRGRSRGAGAPKFSQKGAKAQRAAFVAAIAEKTQEIINAELSKG